MKAYDLTESVFEDPQLANRTWTLRRRVTSPHSELLEFRGMPDGMRVFVKRLHGAGIAGGDRRLSREYRALRVLHRRLGSGWEPSLPMPMVLQRGGRALVVGALDGVPLSVVLKRNANVVTGWLRRDRLAEVGRFAGAWLRRFHDATRRAPVPHDHERFCARLDDVLDRLTARVAVPGVDGLRLSISAASERLSGACLPTAAYHGDFLPQNVLVRDGGVGVLDFEGFRRREIVYRDVGYMLAYTTMLTHRRGYSPAALSAFAMAFETSYDNRLHQDALKLFMAEGAVCIARDSARRATVQAMLGSVAALVTSSRATQQA